METRTFNAGRIRKAAYDAGTQQLDLHWDDGRTIRAYRHVPQEVWRRLCSAPNPTTYWEDRIAEEYPKGTPMAGTGGGDKPKDLRDLFGGGDDAKD